MLGYINGGSNLICQKGPGEGLESYSKNVLPNPIHKPCATVSLPTHRSKERYASRFKSFCYLKANTKRDGGKRDKKKEEPSRILKVLDSAAFEC